MGDTPGHQMGQGKKNQKKKRGQRSMNNRSPPETKKDKGGDRASWGKPEASLKFLWKGEKKKKSEDDSSALSQRPTTTKTGQNKVKMRGTTSIRMRTPA